MSQPGPGAQGGCGACLLPREGQTGAKQDLCSLLQGTARPLLPTALLLTTCPMAHWMSPAQLLAVPGAGWHSSAAGREVGEMTLAVSSPTAWQQHPHSLPTGEELAGSTRLGSWEQLDRASSCQCHSHWWQRSVAAWPLKERHVPATRAPTGATQAAEPAPCPAHPVL